MTPPRTVIEAVLRHVPVLEPGIAQQIAVDVIAAFFAGEVEGPYTVRRFASQRAHPMFRGDSGSPEMWSIDGPTEVEQLFTDIRTARRVAHALNYTATEGV